MTMTSPFRSCFEQYALLGMEKQNKLNSLIGNYLYELDLDAGAIRIDERKIGIQVIGTESDNTLTWLWAWSEEQTEIPEGLLKSSLQLQRWGRDEKIAEFTSPSLDLDDVDGYAISLIASQVCSGSCFFRDDYEGGALYLLLFDSAIDSQPPFDRAGFITGLSDLFSRYDLNHRNAIRAYFQITGLPFEEEGDVVTARLQTFEPVRFEFDSTGTIRTVDGRRLSWS